MSAADARQPPAGDAPKLPPKRAIDFEPTTNDVVQFPDGHLEDVVSVDVESMADMVCTTGSNGFLIPVYLHDDANGITRILRIDGEEYDV